MRRGVIDTGVNGVATCNCFTGTPHMVGNQCLCDNVSVGSEHQPPINITQPLVPVPPSIITNSPMVNNLATWYAANKTTALVIGGIAAYLLFFRKN